MRAALLVLAGCGRIGFEVPIEPLPDGAITTQPDANVVFVTSTLHVPGALGGVAGGDKVCADRAAAAGLRGAFVAWLSSPELDAKDRLGSARGFVRRDGKPIAMDVADLVAGRMIYPPRLDEYGIDLGDMASGVATGTEADGFANSDCAGFTTTDGAVMLGNSYYAAGAWTNTNIGNCSDPYRLYCFETDRVATIELPAGTGPIAFVSSTHFAPTSGLAAADALCMSDAVDAGRSETFKALLQTAPMGAARFDTTRGPWRRVDGVPLAASAEAFLAGRSDVPLDLTASGALYIDRVTTGGTPSQPAATDRNCNEWSQLGGSQDGWAYATGYQTFENTTDACDTQLSVYCLE